MQAMSDKMNSFLLFWSQSAQQPIYLLSRQFPAHSDLYQFTLYVHTYVQYNTYEYVCTSYISRYKVTKTDSYRTMIHILDSRVMYIQSIHIIHSII